MKDYEKRQKDKKGQYKGSIHTNSKKWKKQTWTAAFVDVALFIIFLVVVAKVFGK